MIDDRSMGRRIVQRVGQKYTNNLTSLASKFNFYFKNKMSVDLNISNRPVINKFEGNDRCFHIIINHV